MQKPCIFANGIKFNDMQHKTTTNIENETTSSNK